jgi:hypothetical protein
MSLAAICEKYRLRGEANIPGRFSGEGHLTNAKVKKMTIVSLMFEIVEMYIFQIHLHYFF